MPRSFLQVLYPFDFWYPDIFDLAKIQIYSMFSLIPIFSYNGKKGKNMKYFFYVFYPAHFLVLEGMKYIIDKF